MKLPAMGIARERCYVICYNFKSEKMKKIITMIESAPTKKAAMDMLETWRIFGSVTPRQYEKARELIRKEFEK
jgi:hypothetical protein